MNSKWQLQLAILQMFIGHILADSINILTILPPYYCGNESDRGFRLGHKVANEILPAGLAAVENINKNLRHQLRIEVIHAGDCNVNISQSESLDLLLKFVNLTLYQGKNISGVIHLCHATVSTVFDLSGTSTFKIALSGLISTQNSHQLILNQVISAWYSFMNYVGWTQFGIITDIKDTYSFHLANLLLEGARKYDVNITTNIQYHCTTEIHSPLPSIIFVSINAQNAIQFLCTLHEKRLLWPKHVWVLHSNWYDSILSHSAASDNAQPECNITLARQGVIFLRNQFRPDDIHSLLESGITYRNYYNQYTQKLMEVDNTSLQPSEYANRFHDLVLAAALKFNNSDTGKHDNFTFRGAQGIIKVNSNGWIQSNINFVQIRDAHEVCIAVYNVSGEIHFTDLFFKEAASSYKPRVHVKGGSLFYTVGLATEIALGSLLTTVMLVLLVTFRKEPEVKSTSFTLSLLMFFGCYLTLLYLSLLLYFDQSYDSLHALHLHNNLCRLQPWLSGLGIPLTLTLAVLLVKMLRVYHIFSRLIPGAVGKPCSDLFLMAYVMILLIPSIVVHIVWFAFDEYKLSIKYTSFFVDVIEVEKKCVSQYFYHWLSVLSVNLALLLLALLVVAIKSRKIRLQHFKDTKKVNVLVFAVNVDLFLTLSYWLFLRGINAENHITHVPLHFGHSAFVLLCQVLLFAPKVLPPSQRYISSKRNEHKTHNTIHHGSTF